MRSRKFAPVFLSVLVIAVLSTWIGLTWLSAAPPEMGDGVIIYGDANTNPRQRAYVSSTNSFSAEGATVDGAIPRTLVIETSPIRQEAIAGYQSATGTLQVMCYDGPSNTWTNEWSVTIGSSTQRFDIAYEKKTGDAIVLYSKDVATTNELAYRTKQATTTCGSASWSAETSLNPARTSGKIAWVKLSQDRRPTSTVLAAAWADLNRDLSAMIWSGTAWGNEPTSTLHTSLEVASAAQDVDSFDLDYESLSGDLVIVWGRSGGSNGVNGVMAAFCQSAGASCGWQVSTTPPTFADDATHLDLAANPETNEMVFASLGNAGSDLQAGYWSGTAWTNTANLDTAAGGSNILALHKAIAVGWLAISGSLYRGILIFQDGTASPTAALTWKYTTTGSWTNGTSFAGSPSLTVARTWTRIVPDPLMKNKFMFVFSDDNMDLWAKRLAIDGIGPTFTWTDTEGGATLEDSLPQATTTPFAFNYWQAPVVSQGDYRFYNNNNGYAVGATTTAADNTSTTLANTGDAFRLRFLLHVSSTALGPFATSSSPQFKLQYSTSTANGCDTAFSGENYIDVQTSAGAIRFNDNAAATDGIALSATSSPVHVDENVVGQTYEESNNFVATSTIPEGENGVWDFSLIDFSAPAGTTYCFRAAHANGALLDGYQFIPEVRTKPSGPTVSCSTDITSTSFGTLSDSSVSTAATNASTTMTCSDAAGCTLTVQDDGDGANPGLATTSPAYLIDSADATLVAGTEGYGIQATTTASGSGALLSVRTAYNATGNAVGGLFRTATTLASSTAAVTGRETLVTHKAAISASTLAGSYNDIITYSCVGN